MAPRSISIVIPARNEEEYLPRCLAAIEEAKKYTSLPVETVLVANRCTDRTEDIARAAGCKIVSDESKNLSCIRNAGVRACSGDIVVTIDADSRMSSGMLRDVVQKLSRPDVVGGGVVMLPERWSAGILLTGLCLVPIAMWYGNISGGLFYCLKKDFDAIGGFDEALVSAEDIDFAYRLKRHGIVSRRKFRTIFFSYIVTSCRKFDRLGDWFFFKNPRKVIQALQGRNQGIADEFWYDFER